jgi:hypothetical protein
LVPVPTTAACDKKGVLSWDNTSDRKLECYNVDKLNATHIPILVDYKTNKQLGIVNKEVTVTNWEG